jgi:hypothetical protein
VSPQGAPVAAGSSFLFTNQGDQQLPRDQQQRQPSPQDRWWGNHAAANGAAGTPQRQQSLPPPTPQRQQSLPHPTPLPLQQQQHSMQHPVLSFSPLQSGALGSMRHRYQPSVLTSVAPGQTSYGAQRSGAGRGPNWQSSPGTNSSSHYSRRPSNTSSSSGRPPQAQQSQQQQQQQGLKKGPAGLLVGLWKVLTSYLQVCPNLTARLGAT